MCNLLYFSDDKMPDQCLCACCAILKTFRVNSVRICKVAKPFTCTQVVFEGGEIQEGRMQTHRLRYGCSDGMLYDKLETWRSLQPCTIFSHCLAILVPNIRVRFVESIREAFKQEAKPEITFHIPYYHKITPDSQNRADENDLEESWQFIPHSHLI